MTIDDTADYSSKMEMMTELLEAGVHYGHQTKRWNPKMKDFIFQEKNSIYIIDLSKTVDQLDAATKYLHDLVKGGGKVLFVGCKKAGSGSGSRGRAGQRTVVRESALVGRDADESADDS